MATSSAHDTTFRDWGRRQSLLDPRSADRRRYPSLHLGELMAVNFEPYLKKNTNFTQFLNAGVTYNGNHHFNKTNFTNTPRVIVGLKSYGMYLTVSPLSLNAGFKFRINSMNRTNFTYSVTAYSVTIASVHYQYFAVFGYNDLYYMQFYTITRK